MPPRAPAEMPHATMVDASEENAETTSKSFARPSKEDKSLVMPDTVKDTWNTFHWELNLYSFTVLALIYFFLVPEAYRGYMHVFFGLIAVDASRYHYTRGSMAGVPYTLPMVSLVAMIVNPVRFWREMGTICMANAGLCANSLMGNFMVFITDPAHCRTVFTTTDAYQLYAHPAALWLFGPNNLIYLVTEPHKKVRAILTPALFSNYALGQYRQAQENVVRTHLQRHCQKCQETGQPFDAMSAFRSLGASSSQEAFLGPYLTDDLRDLLEGDILKFTMGFLCFPFPYFGGLRTAIQAKHRIEEAVKKIVPEARAYMEAGNKPRCMLDHWNLAIQTAAKEKGGLDSDIADFCTDDNMANTVLDFLFAAQDATNSALTYALDILEADKSVLNRMHDEVTKAVSSPGDEVWKKLSEEQAMPFTTKVANQMLHHKPPVPMVPHLALKDSYIDGHLIPKGSVLIPSVTYSARVTGASLDFLPEREDHDNQFLKTYTFGAGQHKCPGRRYAESLLAVFLAVVAQEYDIRRVGPRPAADDFIYYPTCFPVDCNFLLLPRKDGVAPSGTYGSSAATSE